MIKSIRLQNFFGFQDCTINLEKGANVLVGINGSGKSNFFKGLKLLKEGITGNFLKNHIFQKLGGFGRIEFLGNTEKKPTKAIVLFELKDSVAGLSDVSELIYEFSIEYPLWIKDNYFLNESIFIKNKDSNEFILVVQNINGEVKIKEEATSFLDDNKREITLKNRNESMMRELSHGYNLVDEIQSYLNDISVYDFFNTGIDSPIRRPVVGSLEKKLDFDGSNLPQILNTLSNHSKNSFRYIEESLKKVNGQYLGIDFLQLATEIELRLEEMGFDKSISVYNISDGTLRFLCLMSILYNTNRGKVVALDEPELGLHPDMILTLSEAIKYAAETSQVIISTHSAQLLDYFNLENIRVFEKNENNATVVNQYSSEEFETFKHEYMPGQLWRDGHLGGNRW